MGGVVSRVVSIADEAKAGPQLPPALREEFLSHARLVSTKRKQTIVSVGNLAVDVYLVVEGRVRVTLNSPNGREVIVREIGPNQLFGELAALGQMPRSASVVALEQTRLASLSGSAFIQLIDESPSLGSWLAKQLSTQIRVLTEKIYELSTMAVGSRLHCELMRLCIENGVDNDRSEIRHAPTHAELAARIGTNRESVTRELGLLADAGVLIMSQRKLSIIAVSQLGILVQRVSGLT
jgi:CRP-like cAMP-binding protein